MNSFHMNVHETVWVLIVKSSTELHVALPVESKRIGHGDDMVKDGPPVQLAARNPA